MTGRARFVQEFPSLSGPHQTEPVPYRKKGIVSMGDTGGLPTGAGEHPVTKHGGRSQHGFSIQKRDRAFQAKGASQGGGPMPTPDLHQTATKVATMLAFHCVRNSYLEDLHAGIFPS